MKQFAMIMLSLMLSLPGIEAQEKPVRWSLQDCLDYALENNLQLQKSRINELSGEEDTKQAKARLFPSLSASVTQGLVNYPSNEVASNSSYNGNYGLNANWTLIDGGRRTNTIKQQELQEEINMLHTEKNEDDIRIAIIQTYLQVMYAIESVRINESTVETSKAQCDRAEQLLQAGSLSKVDVAQMESQHSSDKYQLVVSKNNLENYKLQLKQLLELDIMEDMELVEMSLKEENVIMPLPDKQTIYMTSLAVMPSIKSSELSIDHSKLEINKAQGSYWPTLSLNAGIGTGHLWNSGSTTEIGQSSINNDSFGNQLWNRFNESVGLTLNIPLFSNRENKTALNKAKYAYTTSQLELLNTQKELLKTVEGIYLEATSAQSQFLSATERLKYVEESYILTEEQFYLGMKNTIEMLTEKNNLSIARQEVLQSKYMAVMNLQLLNIYQKLPVDIN